MWEGVGRCRAGFTCRHDCISTFTPFSCCRSFVSSSNWRYSRLCSSSSSSTMENSLHPKQRQRCVCVYLCVYGCLREFAACPICFNDLCWRRVCTRHCFTLLYYCRHCFTLLCYCRHCFTLLCYCRQCFTLLCYCRPCLTLVCYCRQCFTLVCYCRQCFTLSCYCRRTGRTV